MRVISGSAKGRSLKAVSGKQTRPTTDKVKEAIFSSIGPYFDGGMVLDLFAGTGGLGIEALSRGMARGIFIDKSRQAVQVIKHNLQHTALQDQAEVFVMDARRGLRYVAKHQLTFDLVFIDPPYNIQGKVGEGLNIDELLDSLTELGILNEQAIVVVEHDRRTAYANKYGELEMTKQSDYGDTMVTYYTNG